MKLLLNESFGYQWLTEGDISLKGYFQIDGSDVVFKGLDGIKRLSQIDTFEKFVVFLKMLSGVFSIVIKKGPSVWAAVDIARSLPLFYSNDGDILSDSAECIREELNIKKEEVDINNLTELFANYYLFGHKTVYEDIQQLDLGEVAELSRSGIKIVKYFNHINDIDDKEETVLKRKISETANRSFKRIKAAIGNRPVVLSMSGGYDSRFVGCMLKNFGIEDVSCYTYGKASSFEVLQSKKNADALGYRWTCVEMTDDLVKRNLDEIGQSYLDSYTGHDFTAYMQNFAAVRKLHEEGWLKPNSVFLTGLCGDMPTGEYVLPYDSSKSYTLATAAQAVYDLIFNRYELQEPQKENWISEITEVLRNLPITIKDYHSWHQAIDCIYTSSCHVHWYMHMNSVHAFFGYEWLLPYWDKELLMAWYSVPSEYKVKQKMYEDWLMEEVCKPYGLNQKKTLVLYSQSRIKRKIQYSLGGIINYVLLHLGIPFKRQQDYNNFAPLEVELFKRINNHKIINYRRAGMMQLLDNYLIERRYGVENLKIVNKYLKSRE